MMQKTPLRPSLVALKKAWHVNRRGELADIGVMEGRGFGFVTYADPKTAAIFLETKEHSIGEWVHACVWYVVRPCLLYDHQFL
jgi:hypothetical protein